MQPSPDVNSDPKMNSDFSRLHAHLSAALETLSGRPLTRVSIICLLISPIIGVSSVTDLDMLYAAWTLAGGIAGTGMAVAWRTDTEKVRIVMGRATFAMLSGVALPPLAGHYFPWLADLTKNPVLLFSFGALSALVGFLLGYAVFHLIQKRQNRIGSELLRRATGVDAETRGQ